jgi:hypothetical protein
MKAVLLKIGALLMAFIVLFSTLSFTINMHYCNGSLFDTSIIKQVKTCGMNSDLNQNENTFFKGCSVLKDNCCEDKQIAIEGQSQLRILLDKINLDQYLFVDTIPHSTIVFLESLNFELGSQNTSLHLFTTDISIYKLNESYLI